MNLTDSEGVVFDVSADRITEIIRSAESGSIIKIRGWGFFHVKESFEQICQQIVNQKLRSTKKQQQ